VAAPFVLAPIMGKDDIQALDKGEFFSAETSRASESGGDVAPAPVVNAAPAEGVLVWNLDLSPQVSHVDLRSSKTQVNNVDPFQT